MMKHNTIKIVFCCLASLLAWPAQPQVTAETRLSDDFLRAGVSFMAFTQVTDSDAPLVLAATLMDTALELNPKNEQAWAMRVELAKAAGDMDAYEKALQGYLETGVKDERASFNLIQYRVTKSPTLDQQLRSLEELLNSEAGRALSGPLRSRVSLLASSIAGEMLDKAAQRRWAVDAARNDPGNADAARLMRDLVIELGGDNVRVGTATVNIIRANPIDPAPRIDLASLLAQEAAFERAAQQYQVVSTRLSRQPLPMPAYLNWAQCMAMIGQDVQALQFIDQLETVLKGEELVDPAAEAGAEGEAGTSETAGGDAADEPAPEPMELPLQFELIRLAVLDGEDDKAAAQDVLDRIADRLKTAEPTEEEKDQPDNDPTHNLGTIAAVFGPDLDKAESLTDAMRDGGAKKAIAQAWLALRRGDKAKAEPLLRPLAGKDHLADAGLALVMAQDPAGKARLLSSVIQESPGSLASLAAGRALVDMKQAPKPTATGKTLTDLMSKYPESFWLVDVERVPWLEVRLKIDPQRIEPMQPVAAEITVWNTTRFPLAIGEQAPVRPQAMVLISATSSGLPMAPNPPIVVDLGRRYTLNAGERMTFDTRLDYHRFGLLRANNPGLPLVFDARLLVNPVMTSGGSWLANGIGGVSEVRNCLIQTHPASEQDVSAWTEALAGSDKTKRIEALIRLAALNKKTQPELVRPALLDTIRPGLNDVWANGSEAERALIVTNANQLAKESTSYPEFFELATKSDSKLIWLALLARQVEDGESEVLRTAIGRQDMPEISRFAERQRRLMREYETYKAEQERLREEQERLQRPGVIPDPFDQP